MKKSNMKKMNGQMKKYHPNIIVSLLVLRGLVVLAVCIVAGVWFTHGIGAGFSKWGACAQYYSDFLGGALGLTVGFMLDKICIEQINQVIKYSQLIKIVKNELVKIKEVVYWKEIKDSQGNVVGGEKLYVKNEAGLVKIMAKEVELVVIPYGDMGDPTEGPSKVKAEIEKLSEYGEMEHILEFVLDDLVKNAETMSMLATLPLSRGYSEELISELSNIQNCIEHFEYYIGKFERGEGAENELEAKIEWLYMQYHINRVLEVLKKRGSRGHN